MFFGILFVIICFFVCLHMVFGIPNVSNEIDELKKQAIEKGYAMHDPKTGEWKWKE